MSTKPFEPIESNSIVGPTTLTFGDIGLARQLFGEHNGNLNKIATALDVRINVRGNMVFIEGEDIAARLAENILHQLYGLRRTISGANAAPVAQSGINLRITVPINKGNIKGAGPYTNQAGGAFLTVHPCDGRTEVDRILGQERLGATRCSLGLGYAFLYRFRTMGRACYK